MTRPTDILKQEHRHIEQVLNCLERITSAADRGQAPDALAVGQALEFFREFADRCHHGKEEALLFPAMEACGFRSDSGPTAVMRVEHEEGRAAIRSLQACLPRAAAGDPDALRQFVRSGRNYVDLLRQHIQKEDHCLFSMADQALSPELQQKLLDQFAASEESGPGPDRHAALLAIADQLADRYGVAREAVVS